MKQFCCRQRAAYRESAKCIAEVSVGTEIHISFSDQELERRVRLLLREAYVRKIVHRLEISAESLGGSGIGVFRQLFDYFVKFNDS